MKRNRLFELSGIAFVGLVLVAIVGVSGGTPGTGASGDELATFYNDNDVRQFIGTFVLAAATPFAVLFGIALAARGKRPDGGLSGWGYVLLSGSVLVAGSVLLTAFVHFALASGGDEEISPTALEALNSLDGNTWVAFNTAFGVMMVGAAGVLIQEGARVWLGRIALVLGIAAFIPFADFFALLGTLLWFIAASIVLARGTTDGARVGAPGAASALAGDGTRPGGVPSPAVPHAVTVRFRCCRGSFGPSPRTARGSPPRGSA
jgi:hypothetical protein